MTTNTAHYVICLYTSDRLYPSPCVISVLKLRLRANFLPLKQPKETSLHNFNEIVVDSSPSQRKKKITRSERREKGENLGAGKKLSGIPFSP